MDMINMGLTTMTEEQGRQISGQCIALGSLYQFKVLDINFFTLHSVRVRLPHRPINNFKMHFKWQKPTFDFSNVNPFSSILIMKKKNNNNYDFNYFILLYFCLNVSPLSVCFSSCLLVLLVWVFFVALLVIISADSKLRFHWQNTHVIMCMCVCVCRCGCANPLWLLLVNRYG